MRTSGTMLVLLAGAAFGAMGVFGKLAYADGATPGTLLSARFVLAAGVLWAMLLASRDGRRALRALRRGDVAAGLALGGIGYAGQAGGYFTALDRIDASLLSVLVYTYPAIVAVAAAALGRERLDARRVAALACASGGLVLVLAGAGTGALDPVGIALGVATSLIYSAYILVSEGVAGRVAPQVLAVLVCTGAGATLTGASLLAGELRPAAVGAAGWGWLAAIALLSTVAAITLFFAGLRRVGPATAAILSTLEPVVTVVLATAAFGEALAPVQLLGGALVLSAVPVLHLRIMRPAHAAA